MAASDVLVLGCVDAGKTSLMRRLAGGAGASFNSVLDTAPTTGVELDTIAVGGAAEKDARTVSAREIGSAMRPMWHSYYKGAKSVLYCIDMSASACWAESYTDLIDLVSHPDLRGKPFAIVLTKCDAVCPTSRGERVREAVSLCMLSAVARTHLSLSRADGSLDAAASAFCDQLRALTKPPSTAVAAGGAASAADTSAAGAAAPTLPVHAAAAAGCGCVAAHPLLYVLVASSAVGSDGGLARVLGLPDALPPGSDGGAGALRLWMSDAVR